VARSITRQWATNDRPLTAEADGSGHSTAASAANTRSAMSSRHNVTRALAVAELAAPSALADDQATAQAQQRTDVVTGGVRAPDQRTRHALDATTPVTPR
jgi:hypothetical protein